MHTSKGDCFQGRWGPGRLDYSRLNGRVACGRDGPPPFSPPPPPAQCRVTAAWQRAGLKGIGEGGGSDSICSHAGTHSNVKGSASRWLLASTEQSRTILNRFVVSTRFLLRLRGARTQPKTVARWRSTEDTLPGVHCTRDVHQPPPASVCSAPFPHGHEQWPPHSSTEFLGEASRGRVWHVREPHLDLPLRNSSCTPDGTLATVGQKNRGTLLALLGGHSGAGRWYLGGVGADALSTRTPHDERQHSTGERRPAWLAEGH